MLHAGDSPSPRSPRRFILTNGAGLIALAILIWSIVPAKKTESAETGPAAGRGGSLTIPVATVPALRGDIAVHLDGLGTVTPLNTVIVKPRVDGELLRVLYTEGQRVKQGDLLAEIDPRPYAAQLAQNEGQLAKDQALLENAEVDWQRYRELLQKDSIAAQQVAGQKALVSQYRAAIKIDQGQIAATRLQLEYCRITAPIGGRVGLKRVDPGNVVHAGDAEGLVVITQTQPMAVIFTLPEDRLPEIMAGSRKNRTLTVEAYDRNGTLRLAAGKLLAVDNQIDPATGTIKLKAVFPNTDEALFANQFVNVRLNLEPLRGMLVMPTAAIQHGTAGDFVYVASGDGKARMQPVQLGQRDGEQVAVLEGLSEGTAVIVEGADRLRDGSSITVVTSTAAATNKPAHPAESAESQPRSSQKPRVTAP